ncbi:MAG: hypothetical protein SFW66_05025 [Gammaproteobacteria bacterium]|nr:hypothetical protein [Gammaproteobacteria bacterium]
MQSSRPQRKKKPVFSQQMSKETHGIKRIYSTNGKILTVIQKENDLADLQTTMISQASRTCIDDVQFGHRNDKEHAEWHESKEDYAITHFHIGKKNGDPLK